MAAKRADLERHILELLREEKEISVSDVAQAAGLSKFDEGAQS